MFEFYDFFKSIIDSDDKAIVICNLEHIILYMNPAAVEMQKKHGGASLIGKNLMDCHNAASREKIQNIVKWFLADKSNNKMFTHYDAKHFRNVYMVALRNSSRELIGYYEKHETSRE